MDLHVVEVRIEHQPSGIQPTHETEAFREAGIYDGAGGEISYASPQLPVSDIADDPIQTLGIIGGRIADAVAEGVSSGRKVLLAGGNCCVLPGVIGGLQQGYGPTARIGLVWFDAHGDFNTPGTTMSGMLGGMPVAVSAGLCYSTWRTGAKQDVALPTDRIIMVDVRNLDPDEEKLIRATDVKVVPADASSLGAAVEKLAEATDLIYLHIDLDVLDESLTPSHRTREPDGPGVEQTLAAIEAVLRTGKVQALGIVSVYPIGEGGDVSLSAAIDLLRGSVERWRSLSEMRA